MFDRQVVAQTLEETDDRTDGRMDGLKDIRTVRRIDMIDE